MDGRRDQRDSEPRMKRMTTYIRQSDNVRSAEDVLTAELSKSNEEVLRRSDWPNQEIEKCNRALAIETARMLGVESSLRDSVKGEVAMKIVYVHTGAAADVIILSSVGYLSLAECKYGIKYGGAGPFRNSASFVQDIAKKFDKMEQRLLEDQETVRRLRVLVVSWEQLPFTIAHIKALEQMELPIGSFSTDKKKHMYVVCSTTEVRRLIGEVSVSRLTSGSYYIFTL